MSSGGAALQPTFQGHVATTQDALILFEACLQGHLSHVPRRPHDRERSSLIRSGSVFIYEENASGIKRWTDGVTWSPSRILGNFLVYRELDKPFPPGEKKRAMKKQQRRPSRPGEPYPRPEATSFSDNQPAGFGADRNASEIERQLIGSLVDSYGFKADGLVKKTMSVTVQGVTHHLVSYYHLNDVMSNQLRTPSQTENLQYIRPRTELISKQSFRSPIEDVDEVEGAPGAYGYRVNTGGYMQNNTQQAQYYMPQNYPPMAQQPGAPGYGMGVPSMPAPYLQSPVSAPPMQGQRPDYNQYDQTAYNRAYDPSSRSLPATPTSMPSMMPDRNQPQPGGMYPPMSMQRPMNNLSPVSMDSRNPVPYRSSPYPVNTAAPQMDHTRQSQPSPNQIKYEDRRESGQQPSQTYQSPRAPYYPEGAGQQIPQPQYSQPPQMAQWTPQPHPPQ
ncbi:Gti1/Pac2 family-domain-containing protein [Exophiala viscosa]|uniref:Gti1/Pac2 family-domain-containing protein n=1 Tax=Exophiala viscosa TaxID=2486360 RepID=UPI002193400F|nr:Gti1/Pac2 family-domain-containing protein [Exophiala viscosa]